MGWSFNWVSTYGSSFNYDFQVSSTEDATREWAVPMLEDGLMPPIAIQNAEACGTDVVSYMAEGFGFNSFAREAETVYHTLLHKRSRRGVPYGLLPDPRPNADRPK